jgi:hypothetical protein
MRNNDLLVANSMLRRLGMPQPEPGTFPAFDGVKAGVLAAARGIVEPLRKSDAVRAVLRKIALGRNADYYMKAGPKKNQPA